MIDWKEWEKIATFSIKYDIRTLPEFIQNIKELVPKGTKDEDILLEFDCYDTTAEYYDDIIVEANLVLFIKKSGK